MISRTSGGEVPSNSGRCSSESSQGEPPCSLGMLSTLLCLCLYNRQQHAGALRGSSTPDVMLHLQQDQRCFSATTQLRQVVHAGHEAQNDPAVSEAGVSNNSNESGSFPVADDASGELLCSLCYLCTLRSCTQTAAARTVTQTS